MSFKKYDRSFHNNSDPLSDAEIAKIVSHALRNDYGHEASSIKAIGDHITTNLRTIRNWYDAINAPSAAHFLTLTKSSITLQKFMIAHVFGEGLWEDFELILAMNTNERKQSETTQITADFEHKNVPINVPIKLNKRQKWFLIKLSHGEKPLARDIENHWHVDRKIAQRDINKLKDANTVCFKGSKKTGYYELITIDNFDNASMHDT